MGYKHPYSLKLNFIGNWKNLIYNQLNNKIIFENLIEKILKLYFQKNYFISNPIFLYKYNNKVKIILFIYTFNINNQIINIKKLENYIYSLFGIYINIKLIKLNSPYLNSDILSQLIALNLRKYSIYKIWKKLKKIIPMTKYNIKKEYKFLSFNYIKIKEFYLNKNIISNIFGMKWIIKGRLMKRKRASRSKKLVFTKGAFHFNSLHSLIDYKYSNILKKGIGGSLIKNGSIGIKIFLSNNISFKNIN